MWPFGAEALGSAGRLYVQKKTAHALEQDRPDVLRRRQAWFEGQLDSIQLAWCSSTKRLINEDGKAEWSGASRRALPIRRASRPLEDHRLRRRLAPHRHDGIVVYVMAL